MKTLLAPERKLAIVEAREIVDDIRDRVCIDWRDPFHKVFFYEICPLLVIAQSLGPEATHIVFMGPNVHFDGLIFLAGAREGQKVEMTAAIDGYNNALLMELLEERGRAPPFQLIQATGTKRNRTFGSNDTQPIRSLDYHNTNTLLPLLRNALASKQDKAKQNEHYTGAWLGIVFEDRVLPLHEKKNERFDPICKQALGEGPEHHAPFSRIFFVGVSRRYLFDSWQTLGHDHRLPGTDSGHGTPPTKS